MVSIIKTLTILPDLDTVSPTAITAPVAETSATAEQVSDSNAPAGIPDGPLNTQPGNAAQQPARPSFGAEESAPKAAPPARKRHAQTTRNKQERHATFRLKLSGEPIDESRIGKISTEERELLLARQKLFDADDQMASFLALQHQVKQLQDELGEIKLKLASLDRSPSAAAPPAPPVADTPERAPAPADAKPAVAVKKPPVTVQQGNPMLQRGLLAAGLALAITALLLLLRRHTRLKSQQAAEPMLTQAAVEKKPAVIQIVSPRIAVPASVAPAPAAPVSSASPPARMETQTVTLPKMEITPKEAAPQRPQPKKEEEGVAEEDLMLEEAELYAAHGHQDNAIKILHEIIAQNPAHTEARVLLISILSSLSRVEEFEQAAREFFKYNKNSESWKMVQTLGRTLDQGNPLYMGDGALGAAAIFLPQIAINKCRPVGDVLVEMDALSVQDMKNCLADFDPKVHGRFGGYLISRKVITLAQLNEALLKQQGTDAGTKPGILPTLQDMENLLADFNPQRDGSIGEYLLSRKAITPEQLHKVLQQQSSSKAPAKTPQPSEPPAPDISQPLPSPVSSTSLDFVLEPASEKDQPLDFEVTQPLSPFPEIDLGLGNSNPPEQKSNSK